MDFLKYLKDVFKNQDNWWRLLIIVCISLITSVHVNYYRISILKDKINAIENQHQVDKCREPLVYDSVRMIYGDQHTNLKQWNMCKER